MSNDYLKRIRYAYIIGIGRSGTTLLSKLFNQHKNCLVSLEIEFLIFFKNNFEKKNSFSKDDFRLIVDFLDVYKQRQPMLKVLLDTSKLYDDLCDSNINDYKDLTKFIHLRFNFFNKPLEELELLIDKNPSYSLHIHRLLKFSPEARFIYMVRDYRANILSRKQSVERRSPDTAFNCYRWLFYNKRVCKTYDEKESRIYQIKYEDLVSQPQQYMQQMAAFLELADEDATMNFYKGKKDALSEHADMIKGMSDRYKKTLSDVEKPVFTDRIEKWTQELAEEDILICEAICGDFAERFGYKKTRSISFVQKMSIQLRAFPQYLKAVYDYYREFLLYYFSPRLKLKRVKQKFNL